MSEIDIKIFKEGFVRILSFYTTIFSNLENNQIVFGFKKISTNLYEIKFRYSNKKSFFVKNSKKIYFLILKFDINLNEIISGRFIYSNEKSYEALVEMLNKLQCNFMLEKIIKFKKSISN